MRLRGLRRLLHDGVKQGTDFVEEHHRHAAAKPFRILESIQLISQPTKVVHAVHDGVLSLTYGGIRTINQATALVDGWVLDRMHSSTDADERPSE